VSALINLPKEIFRGGKMTNEIKPSEVVFFLGAGASVPAGVPDTRSFVNQFTESISDTSKKSTVEKIVETLKDWKGPDIDVELLLETLTKLRDKEREPLLQFYEGGNFALTGYYEKEPLINDLKDFIKKRAIVAERNVQYLQPLRDFVDERRPVDIISVNYDTCIEQFCNSHKLVYQDGFDVNWNPKIFGSEDTDIRLYKLHGSVIWYQSGRGGYMKLPVRTEKSEIKLITDEKAENLMLYPMQKWDYAEPLLELLVEVKRLLESKECKFLVVIGYSFRDEHLRRLVWDAAKKNRQLHLILVDPNASQIYFEKLKYYDNEQTIPSSLYGKVICLPYGIEKVFSYVKNSYLKSLREGLSEEIIQHQAEIKSQKPNWVNCIQSFVRAEYTEKIDDLLGKVGVYELQPYLRLHLEFYLKLAVNYLSSNLHKGIDYLDNFNTILYTIAVDGITADVDPYGVEITFRFKCHDLSIVPISSAQLYDTIFDLLSFCQIRYLCVDFFKDEFQNMVSKLQSLERYLIAFKKNRIELLDYANLRAEEKVDIQSLKEKPRDWQARITEIERDILKGILTGRLNLPVK
jgi:hypothetical protein